MKTKKNGNIVVLLLVSFLGIVTGGCNKEENQNQVITPPNLDLDATLLYSSDGGNSWIKYSIALVEELRSITSFKSGTLIAVGENASTTQELYDGIIIRSTAGGNNFTKQIDTDGKILYDISSNGIIVGQDGLVMLTTNEGINWTTISTPTSSRLNAVHFANPNLGAAAGYSGLIIRTINGGLNWSIVSDGLSMDFYDIKFFNSTTGIAVGRNEPRIMKSTNGGINWNAIGGVENDLNAFSFMEGTGYGIAVGSFIFKTADYGSTWRRIAITQQIRLNDVKVLGTLCYAAGYSLEHSNLSIVKSTDYGETWLTITHPSAGELYEIYITDNGAIWVACD
ncbi:MAG TPA: YCF48-related protein [Ignavibacteria bacterium]|jgi:photosystem II stability/assembly factor-like uncharacterized protein